MKNLIFADVKRILRKPAYWIVLGICLLISLFWSVQSNNSGGMSGFSFASNQGTAVNTMNLFIGIAIYVSVYADEFTSNSMQCLIGRGISRRRLLIAKFINCVIVTFISYGIYTLFITITGLIMGAKMNGSESSFLYSTILTNAFIVLGYATISMIILFWSKNVAYATLVDAFLLFAGSTLMSGLNSIPAISIWHIDRHIFSQALECAKVDLLLTGGTAIFTLLWHVVKICAISIILAYLLFRKKELDF
ncbi:ABC transporter permease [Butyrivibrio sp. VCD2006]|uniref:ABC transporter permease n=1 Tax=Butyrivibrio sp. VCD2006 TaxID=1280664 RepID=UPI000428CACE|nr:ABC transporter permease [Butyrivibrio sp. VCD2006]